MDSMMRDGNDIDTRYSGFSLSHTGKTLESLNLSDRQNNMFFIIGERVSPYSIFSRFNQKGSKTRKQVEQTEISKTAISLQNGFDLKNDYYLEDGYLDENYLNLVKEFKEITKHLNLSASKKVLDHFASLENRYEKLEKIVNFVKTVGKTKSSIYFNVIALTGNVVALTDERVLNNTGFIRYVISDITYSYFKAIAITGRVEELTNKGFTRMIKNLIGRVAFDTSIKLLERLCEVDPKTFSEMIKYYSSLTNSIVNSSIFLEGNLVTDPRLLKVAYRNIKKGSANIEKFILASYLYKKMKGRENFDINKLFESHRLIEPIKNALREDGIPIDLLINNSKKSNMELLQKSLVNIIINLESIKRNLEKYRIYVNNVYDKGIKTGWKTIPTQVLGRINLSNSKIHVIKSRDAFDMLVLGINGSKNHQKAKEARERLKEVFYRDIVNGAVSAWGKIRKKYINQLAEAYYTNDRNRVIEIFKNAIKEANGRAGKNIEMLDTIVNNLEPIIKKEKMELNRGDQIVAFITMDNILNIRSSYTGACVFIGGGKESIVMDYATKGAVLIDFTIANAFKSNETILKQIEYLKVYGVVIAIPVTIKGKRTLFVDSFEGGIKFAEAAKGHESELVDIIKNAARKIGAKQVAFYADPHNSFPRKFVTWLKQNYKKKLVAVKPITNEKVFLEGLKNWKRKYNTKVILIPLNVKKQGDKLARKQLFCRIKRFQRK